MELRACCELSEERRLALQRAVATHTTMEHVARWVFSQTPPLDIVDIVRQDEFTHDVLVPLPDGLVLVYDST